MALPSDKIFEFQKIGLTISGLALAAVLGFLGNMWIKRYELQVQHVREKKEKRLKLLLPLLRFSHNLDRRLARMLSSRNLEGNWLSRQHLDRVHEGTGFALDIKETGYFIVSTVYHLACIFGWAEAIKKMVDSNEPDMKGKRAWFFTSARRESITYIFDKEFSIISRIFQFEEMFDGYLRTARVSGEPFDAVKFHKLVQYSVGELMLETDGEGNYRCKSFREFTARYYTDKEFRYWFEPIVQLIENLSGFESERSLEAQALLKKDLRPLRLIALRYWNRVLVRDLAQQLHLDNNESYKKMQPDDVLQDLSPELREAIKRVEFGVEPYIGVSFYE